MRVVVTSEFRYLRTPDGHVWTPSSMPYSFWIRYLAVFDAVRVVARIKDVPEPESNWKRADGERVSFIPIPYYVGPWQFLLKLRSVLKTLSSAVVEQDAVILRVPSQLATLVQRILVRNRHCYALEVVGDPYDVFGPGGVKSFLRPVLRYVTPRHLRKQCSQACAVAYVTKSALQQRYPSAPTAVHTHYSSIELPSGAFVHGPREYLGGSRRTRLITVGSLEQMYKAPDILIEAVRLCTAWGLDLELNILGDGKYRSKLELLVKRYSLEERVRFLGQVPSGEPVRQQLDEMDLFVLPSRTEGLPRAMIEAMARGLPCIGTSVGGIPELLGPEYLVRPNNAKALAEKIAFVLANPQELSKMSRQNLRRAKDYHEDALSARRDAFYAAVQKATTPSGTNP